MGVAVKLEKPQMPMLDPRVVRPQGGAGGMGMGTGVGVRG